MDKKERFRINISEFTFKWPSYFLKFDQKFQTDWPYYLRDDLKSWALWSYSEPSKCLLLNLTFEVRGLFDTFQIVAQNFFRCDMIRHFSSLNFSVTLLFQQKKTKIQNEISIDFWFVYIRPMRSWLTRCARKSVRQLEFSAGRHWARFVGKLEFWEISQKSQSRNFEKANLKLGYCPKTIGYFVKPRTEKIAEKIRGNFF